jgi:hypothetical protein
VEHEREKNMDRPEIVPIIREDSSGNTVMTVRSIVEFTEDNWTTSFYAFCSASIAKYFTALHLSIIFGSDMAL